MVRSLPCFIESQPVHVIVQPGLTGNTASADQAICINTQAGIINGALPAGGNGVYAYQWQQSTDGGNSWNDIPGANAQSFNPGVLTATTKFRRRVSTALCSGPQASTSNIVTVTVHPDAKALFQPADTVGCAPWQLTPASINLQTFPAQNGQYAWYVDNAFIGNGPVFPGYTMAQENDTITVKLVAISSFGCLSDSVSHTFYTFKLPHPAFTLSDTVGCGPLTVQLNNTTPDLSLYNYQWNFGNGQSSMNANPGTMVFLPNPDSGDTTYTVSLSVVSPCDTRVVTKTVRVKAKPKTLFAPDASVGCSPMTVSFNNNSRGLGNSYTWNFGDGSAPVPISTTGITSHTFITGIADTFFVQLTGSNECGKDSLSYAIVVRPNSIHLDFAVNGNQQSGCAPHAVSFINNSSGASAFTWTFGNGNVVNTTRNIDTLTQTFASPGTYVVLLHASNGCSDTSSTETVVVYPTPRAAFRTPTNLVCLGDSIRFSNFSDSATSYLWEFGDGTNSALANPVHTYATPGTYRIRLTAFRLNAPGSICMDTVVQQVQVVSSMKGSFTVSDTLGYCAPFTVSFSNANLPSHTALWDFGDNTTGSGNTVGHTYLQAGIYPVKLTVTVPGGCTYVTTRNIQVLGPTGSWSHTTGYVCNNNTANFQVQANNADSLLFQFGDGQTLTTTSHVAYHSYTNPGIYLPRVVLKNNAGCLVPLTGMDSIRVDRIRAGFSAAQQNLCGSTTVNFTDTTHAYFGKARVSWSFGDNTSGTGSNVSHTYTTTGNYTVKMIVLGNSGCSDTMVKAVNVVVNAKPKADIVGDTLVCARYALAYTASIQSTDAVNVTQWNLSNGATGTGTGFGYAFIQPGNYSLRLIVGTVPGCYDTVTKNIKVNPTPVVSASSDLNLCRGTSIQLHASSGTPVQYDWTPLQGLSCNSCTDPMAAPLITTPYVVKATNNFGCAATDTTVVTVIQPLRLTVSASDSICIGSSTNLLASGGSSYAWSPGIGLNNSTLSNPTASPSVTTNYRVVGYDGYNCFTDTAFVLVAVGQYPVVRLAPDQVLATGTLFPLSTTILNGPIKNWNWTPVTDLSCANCALPIAEIKKDISYRVTVTNNYGCTATDTIAIRVFCESAQVFIPNAFTPDGDGYNDVLMVRASGIAVVKTFRIFNRWGEVVFEKGGFPPNNPAYGWDGRIKGVLGGPDVFVYTAEVVCENGSTYTYKGNVSLLK
jgi:gliding motility-associated-like protein